MAVRIEHREGLWLVYEGGALLYSGGYRQVQDWLDLAENAGRLAPVPATAATARRFFGHHGWRKGKPATA
jgi:hypothetical protein